MTLPRPRSHPWFHALLTLSSTIGGCAILPKELGLTSQRHVQLHSPRPLVPTGDTTDEQKQLMRIKPLLEFWEMEADVYYE